VVWQGGAPTSLPSAQDVEASELHEGVYIDLAKKPPGLLQYTATWRAKQDLRIRLHVSQLPEPSHVRLAPASQDGLPQIRRDESRPFETSNQMWIQSWLRSRHSRRRF